jgi:hypothetical protein
MSKLSLSRRQARASAGRALLFGLVLAAALSTLAGGGATQGVPAAPSARSAAPSSQPHTAQLADRFAAGLHAGATARVAAGISAAAARAQAQEPPPFAPGGDDVMNWDEPARRAVSAVPPVRQRDIAPLSAAGFAGASSRGAVANVAAAPGRSAPSLMLWLDRPRAGVGEHVVLHVATLGDAQCQGLGLLSGMQPVAGRILVRAASAGRHQLAVRCVGMGGSVERSVVLMVPLPVLPSSQLNASVTDPTDPRGTTLPTPEQLSQLGVGADGAQARGDYFQEGRLAIMVATMPSAGAGSLHFLARDEQGEWRDRSSELLRDDERWACPGPAQAITVDVNQDGRPDVFLACHARAANTGLPGAPCCQQLLLLSQPDGRYRRVEMAHPVWAAQIVAADIDGNGSIDILAFDAGQTPADPQPWLLGRGDGSFVAAGPARAGASVQGRW